MLKKVCGNDVDFSISKIMSIKVHGNDVDILISEITSKKYVEMSWKFIEIWSLTIDVISTSNRRGFDVCARWTYFKDFRKNQKNENKIFSRKCYNIKNNYKLSRSES